MNPGLNWVDFIILTLLLFFSLEALGKNLIMEILDFFGFLLALILSFNYYNFPSKFFGVQFEVPHGLSLVLGFITIWFLTETLLFVFIRFFLSKNLIKIKTPYQGILSVIPALLRGIIFIALILVLTATFPIQPSIKKAVNESKIGSILLKESLRLEKPVKDIFGGFTQDSLTFLTIQPKSNQRVNLGFHTPEYTIDEKTEILMTQLVNKERTSRGLESLRFDAKLREAGRFHSQDMFERGYFSHYSPEGEDVSARALRFGVEYLVIGENLAYAPTLELAHQGLMNSEGHRANILSLEFNKIGIGVIDGGIYGKMFTQVFSD